MFSRLLLIRGKTMKYITGLVGWFVGLIVSGLLTAILGYWSSGAVVGFAGVGVYGWVAALFMMFWVSFTTGALAFGWHWNQIWPFGERKARPVESVQVSLPELTAEAGRCALFFRGILAEDPQAQVLIDELLVRATRAACGVKTDADYEVNIAKSGVVNFQPKGA